MFICECGLCIFSKQAYYMYFIFTECSKCFIDTPSYLHNSKWLMANVQQWICTEICVWVLYFISYLSQSTLRKIISVVEYDWLPLYSVPGWALCYPSVRWAVQWSYASIATCFIHYFRQKSGSSIVRIFGAVKDTFLPSWGPYALTSATLSLIFTQASNLAIHTLLPFPSWGSQAPTPAISRAISTYLYHP